MLTKLNRLAGLAGLLALAVAPFTHALELHTERASPFDLAIKGRLEGVPAGETRYLRRAELESLPSRSLTLTGEFIPGQQEVTIVLVEDLLARLPRSADADTLIATCTDGYAAVYTDKFIADYKPFLVLAINGQGPEAWPPAGLTYNPGPYVISVAGALAPAVDTLLDVGHKRPWGVDTIELAHYPERFATLHTGGLENPSPIAAEGRDLWLNSCFACHEIPQAGRLGGTKAARPIQIIAAQASYNTDYFKTYVRTPTKVNPAAKMQPHPDYTDAQLDALIAFLRLTLAP